MAVKFSNNAATTLSAGISSGVTQFSVASATGFPTLGGSDWTYVTIDTEVVKITAISGTTFTCIATTASHSSGDNVELRMTAELLDDFATDTESLPLAGGAMTGAITTNSTFDTRDVATDGTKLDGIDASANNYVHPNHSGDVVSTADGATVIQTDAVDIAMLSATGTASSTTFLRGDNTWAAGGSTSASDLTSGTLPIARIADDAITADKLANSINSEISANTAKVTNATHTGDVTGSTTLTIATDAVDIDHLSATGTAGATTFLRGDNTWVVPTDTDNDTTYTAGTNVSISGTNVISSTDTGDTTYTAGTNVSISGTNVISSTDTNTVYTHPNHSGDVVSAADGAMTIQTDAVDIAMLSATGTASSSTFLRGDNTWVTPTDTNTNTTYTAGTGLTLSAGNEFSAGALAITTVQTASTQAAQLLLTAQEGDVVIRSDENKSYIHNSGSAGTMADYTLLSTPTSDITSITTSDSIDGGGTSGIIDIGHITTAGHKHIPTGGGAGQFLKYSASGTAIWAADNNTTYSVGDGGLTQKNFTTTLKTKLDNITGTNTGDDNQSVSATAISSTTNLDTLTSNGWYKWGSSSPTNAPATYGLLLNSTDGSQPQQLIQTYGGAANSVKLFGRRKTSGTWDTIWTEYWSDRNDGASSGLDADTLDGVQGSGYATSSHTHSYLPLTGGTTTGAITATDFHTTGWYRNSQTNEGMYNTINGNHFYSSAAQYWSLAYSGTAGGLIIRDGHNGTARGYFYANDSGDVGILDGGGSWAYRHREDAEHEWRVNNIEKMTLSSGGNLSVDGTFTGTSANFSGNIDTRTAELTTATNLLYFGIYNGNAAGTGTAIGTGITWKPNHTNYTKRSAGIMQIGEGNYFRSGLAFYTNGTSDATTDWSERMRLDMNGNLGLGTSSITDSNWGTGNKEFAIDGTTGYAVIHLRGTGAGSTDTRFSQGVGDGQFYMAYDDVAATHRLTISSTGTAAFSGAVTWSGGGSANANTAYADRNKWDGGSSGLTAATGRTSLGLGTAATTAATAYAASSHTHSYVSSTANTSLGSGWRETFFSGSGGVTFAANHYSIGVDVANGAWTSPNYSDLVIGYHTGIRIGASYTGVRFYNNSPTTDTNNTGNGNGVESLLMTVGGVAGGSGVKVVNALTAGSLVTAGTVTWSGGGSANANTAYGWGNHASGSYLTSTNDRFYITDTRSAARAPSYYDDRYVQADFNQSTNFGVSGGDSWGTALTVSKWASYDATHRQEQLIFAGTKLCRRVATSDAAWSSTYTIWDSSTDGSGSGLDADTLDGVQGSGYATSTQGTTADNALPKAGGTMTGNLLTSGSGNYVLIGGAAANNHYNAVTSTSGLTFGGGNDFNNYSIGTTMQNIGGNYTKLNIKWHTGIRTFAMPQYGGIRFHSDAAMATEIFSIGNLDGHVRAANNLYANGGNLVWNASNDGSGSGLDADLLDGQQGTYWGSGAGNQDTTYTAGTGLTLTSGVFSSDLDFTQVGGYDDLGLGSNALANRSTGNYNVAVGTSSLRTLTTTDYNTAVGYAALYKMNTGQWNTAVGAHALMENTSGENNTAVGAFAMDGSVIATTGSDNTAVGLGALGHTGFSGSQNVGIGSYGASSITSGDNNIAIGYNVQAQSDTANNQINIGNKWKYDDTIGHSWVTASNEDMRLTGAGDLHVDGDITAYSTTIPSDERLKHNIKPIENALYKVGQLNGCTFTYNTDGRESAGLIAQDVEKVLPSAVTEKELPLKIDDGNEYKVLQYDQTIGLLVEAIKELKTEVDNLKQQLKE